MRDNSECHTPVSFSGSLVKKLAFVQNAYELRGDNGAGLLKPALALAKISIHVAAVAYNVEVGVFRFRYSGSIGVASVDRQISRE